MIYLFLADGFEEIEALGTVDVLRRAKLDVKTVGVTGDIITSSRGIKVIPDVLIDDIDNLDVIILPGGMPGSTNLLECQKLKDMIIKANNENKLLCAICAAPMILGEHGVLENKDATCYPGFESHLKGANVINEKVVVSKNVITGIGAGASIDFALAIVEVLKSKDEAIRIKNSMEYM